VINQVFNVYDSCLRRAELSHDPGMISLLRRQIMKNLEVFILYIDRTFSHPADPLT
jgi:hypothetical protein